MDLRPLFGRPGWNRTTDITLIRRTFSPLNYRSMSFRDSSATSIEVLYSGIAGRFTLFFTKVALFSLVTSPRRSIPVGPQVNLVWHPRQVKCPPQSHRPVGIVGHLDRYPNRIVARRPARVVNHVVVIEDDDADTPIPILTSKPQAILPRTYEVRRLGHPHHLVESHRS